MKTEMKREVKTLIYPKINKEQESGNCYFGSFYITKENDKFLLKEKEGDNFTKILEISQRGIIQLTHNVELSLNLRKSKTGIFELLSNADILSINKDYYTNAICIDFSEKVGGEGGKAGRFIYTKYFFFLNKDNVYDIDFMNNYSISYNTLTKDTFVNGNKNEKIELIKNTSMYSFELSIDVNYLKYLDEKSNEFILFKKDEVQVISRKILCNNGMYYLINENKKTIKYNEKVDNFINNLIKKGFTLDGIIGEKEMFIYFFKKPNEDGSIDYIGVNFNGKIIFNINHSVDSSKDIVFNLKEANAYDLAYYGNIVGVYSIRGGKEIKIRQVDNYLVDLTRQEINENPDVLISCNEVFISKRLLDDRKKLNEGVLDCIKNLRSYERNQTNIVNVYSEIFRDKNIGNIRAIDLLQITEKLSWRNREEESPDFLLSMLEFNDSDSLFFLTIDKKDDKYSTSLEIKKEKDFKVNSIFKGFIEYTNGGEHFILFLSNSFFINKKALLEKYSFLENNMELLEGFNIVDVLVKDGNFGMIKLRKSMCGSIENKASNKVSYFNLVSNEIVFIKTMEGFDSFNDTSSFNALLEKKHLFGGKSYSLSSNVSYSNIKNYFIFTNNFLEKNNLNSFGFTYKYNDCLYKDVKLEIFQLLSGEVYLSLGCKEFNEITKDFPENKKIRIEGKNDCMLIELGNINDDNFDYIRDDIAKIKSKLSVDSGIFS